MNQWINEMKDKMIPEKVGRGKEKQMLNSRSQVGYGGSIQSARRNAGAVCDCSFGWYTVLCTGVRESA